MRWINKNYINEIVSDGMGRAAFYRLRVGLKYILLVFLLTCALVSAGLLFGQKWRTELRKLTAFECGFDPLSSSRIPFSIRFFLIALLFLIFDVEIVLLFPYIFRVKILFVNIVFLSKIICSLFLLILVLGLFHEINEGRLEWKY